MRLINATKFQGVLLKKARQYSKDGVASNFILKCKDWLKYQPTINPVHAAGGCYCRECAFRHTTDCALDYAVFETTDETFCSYGRRREADGE